MLDATVPLSAEIGDRLVINPRPVRGVTWDGEIIAVLGADGHPPFVVRWSHSRRVTCVSPGPDACVDTLCATTPLSRRA